MIMEIAVIFLDYFNVFNINFTEGNCKYVFIIMLIDIVIISIILIINLKVKADINLFLDENIT